MPKLAWLLISATWLPGAAFSEDLPASPCVDALEQVATLKTDVAVYKQLPGDQRHYLKDADRPAELARISKIVAASCSSDPTVQAAQHAAAERLHTARSPECAVERDKLSAMEHPDSRESRDSIAAQRKLVADQCPAVPMAGVWLLQMVWAKP
ncbi:MAG TPA: hypothetical protein VEG26_02600 [Steroidobacteraceae bacterium]|nr:hypothetical protein [Steroidobacteraceae bacterium]